VADSSCYILFNGHNDNKHALALSIYTDNMPLIAGEILEYFNVRLLLAAEVKGRTRS
jgi:hypothetical protein